MSNDETPQQTGLISAGLRYMAISSFFFSIMGVLVKVAGERLPSQEIVFFRSLLVLIFAYAMIKRAKLNARGNNKKLLIVRGLTGFIALSKLRVHESLS